jgi:hypothetical protein
MIELPEPASYRAGMRATLVLVLAGSIAGAGCEKAGPSASGKLSDDEASLMSRLPNNVGLAFGGNLPRLQKHLADSPLMKFARLGNEMVSGTNAWQDCLAEKKFKQMMGTVDARDGFELKFIMTGLEMDDLEGCAKHAKMTYKLDADHKFIAIDLEGPGFSTKLPYLVLSDGAIYGKYSVNIALGGADFKETSRRQMEDEIAATKNDNATENDKLLATMEKADRKMGMWFAGSAEGTMIGDKVHEVFGSLDLEGGLDVDATVEMADKKLAGQILDSIDQARDSARLLGPELKKVLDALTVKKDGDRIRFTLKVSNRQLSELFDKFGSMMGGGMGGRRDALELEP